METIWRPKRQSLLSVELLNEKLAKDEAYELAVQKLYATLPHDKAQAQKKVLWTAYQEWAKASGLYEQITPQQQLTEVETELAEVLDRVNTLRTNLKMPTKLVR